MPANHLDARERRVLLSLVTDDFSHGQIDIDRIAHFYLRDDIARAVQIVESGMAKLGLSVGDLADPRQRELVAAAIHQEYDWAVLVGRLIKARKAKGLTQAGLAEIMLDDVSTVGRFETMAHIPTLATFIKFAEALGLEVGLKEVGA
jgi:hypothetical protein